MSYTNIDNQNLNFIDDVIDKVKITQEQYQKLVNKFNKDLVHKKISTSFILTVKKVVEL